jgi:release factor glutamine methyltransferase
LTGQEYKKCLLNELIFYDEGENMAILQELLYHININSQIDPWLMHEFDLSQEAYLMNALEELKTGKPLQYITGYAAFFGLNIGVNEHTLIPRPETELLCDIISKNNSSKQQHILDIGTGSGCIVLGLLNHKPLWTGLGIDKSQGALQKAEQNAKELNLNDRASWKNCDILLDYLDFNVFDIIISNPPYIAMHEAQDMTNTVLKYEPKDALFTPDDEPLVFYQKIYDMAKSQNYRGDIFLELNALYAQETADIFRDMGPILIEDYQKKMRFMHIAQTAL